MDALEDETFDTTDAKGELLSWFKTVKGTNQMNAAGKISALACRRRMLKLKKSKYAAEQAAKPVSSFFHWLFNLFRYVAANRKLKGGKSRRFYRKTSDYGRAKTRKTYPSFHMK